jgi:hypothetical protein
MSRDTIICLSVSAVQRLGGTVIAGSVKRACVNCGGDIWVSPSSLRIQREYDAELSCMTCAAENISHDGIAGIHPIRTDQIKELARHQNRSEDEIESWFKTKQ